MAEDKDPQAERAEQDVEGQRVRKRADDEEDVEGQAPRKRADDDEDDTEGHRMI